MSCVESRLLLSARGNVRGALPPGHDLRLQSCAARDGARPWARGAAKMQARGSWSS
jgi:hypothetical protein